MRNYKLLDALEAYLLAEKESAPNSVWKKRVQLEKVVANEVTTEDIQEVFSDLRDYWETLKK